MVNCAIRWFAFVGLSPVRIASRRLNAVFWEQQGIQIGGHKIQISRSAAATQPAAERHFRDQIDRWGKVHVVNLLSQKEAEAQLTEAFSQQVLSLGMSDYVRLTNFDFHAVVKGNQFDNLSSLIQMLRQSIKEYGGFLMNLRSREIVSLQQGVFRVNCLDCLDRYAIIYDS
jgi:hypothetical protein